MWVDSHCHLDFDDFVKGDGGLEAVIERARLNKISHMLTISTHTQRVERYTAIADEFDNVYTTIGVHPHQANEEVERDITADQLVKLATSHPKIVAIGECGLDYHYDFAPKDVQERVFTEHIKACLELDMPIIIHSREADDDMMRIIEEAGQGKLKGVMHCYSSGPELARKALELGLYISFSGIVTFNSAKELQEICKTVPQDRILVETDAPYLAPVPYRGKTNEPSFVSHTGRKVAELHGIVDTEMAQITTDNFFKLFSKAKR